MDKNFQIKDIYKSPDFQIVNYKKGLYIGEYTNKQRNGLGLFIT